MEYGAGQPPPRRKMLAAALAVGVVVLCLAFWPFAKAHLQAVAVLREVAGQPVPRVARELTVPVTTEDLSLSIATRTARSRCARGLYPAEQAARACNGDLPRRASPGHRRAAAGGLCLGDGGLRHSRADAGAARIKDYHVSQDSVATIGESVKWFVAQTGGPVGVMGLSFSGGLALWRRASRSIIRRSSSSSRWDRRTRCCAWRTTT